MKQRWLFGAILIATITVFFSALRAFGAVTLKYFEVSYISNRVKLRWETATELDNLGFMIKKKITGSSESFQTVKLCAKTTPCSETEKKEFIFAAGDIFGQTYGDFFDDDLQPDTSYTYQLIAIDTSQREEVAETKTVVTSEQPVSTAVTTVPSSTTTTTSTATTTPTNNPPTATPQQNNPNPPRTRKPTLTATIPQLQPTLTPTQLPSPSLQPPTETPAPTVTETVAELIIPTLPLPSITLIFPYTPTPYPNVPTETPQVGTIPKNATWFTPSRLLVIGLIVMIWLILGGWFVFALRKIQ